MIHSTNQKHYYDMCRYLHVQTKCVIEMDEDSSENDLLATKLKDSRDDKMVSGLLISFQEAILLAKNYSTV